MIQFENAIAYFNGVILAELYDQNIKTWIAGGIVRDYFMAIPLRTDFDLFFPDKENWEKAVKHILSQKNAHTLYESENSTRIKWKKHIFDLIKVKFFSSPQQTIDTFDFTVCQLAVDEKEVFYGETTFIDLAKRQLMLHRPTALLNPGSTMSRAFKYHVKGFKMCVGEQRKLLEAIQNDARKNLDLESSMYTDYEIFKALD